MWLGNRIVMLAHVRLDVVCSRQGMWHVAEMRFNRVQVNANTHKSTVKSTGDDHNNHTSRQVVVVAAVGKVEKWPKERRECAENVSTLLVILGQCWVQATEEARWTFAWGKIRERNEFVDNRRQSGRSDREREREREQATKDWLATDLENENAWAAKSSEWKQTETDTQRLFSRNRFDRMAQAKGCRRCKKC